MNYKKCTRMALDIASFRDRGLKLILAMSILIMLATTVSSALAFDGNRKGFVAGFGVGGSPLAHWSSPSLSGKVTEQGAAGELLLGYAWDNANILAWNSAYCLYSTSKLKNSTILQGVDNIRWYHYWGKDKPTFYTVVGIGLSSLGTEYTDFNGSGFGYCVGFGKEILKQVQIGTYVIGGHTSSDAGVKANHFAVLILVSLIAY